MTRDSPLHTACVWSEKTTVCRIFSCQRTAEATRPGPIGLTSSEHLRCCRCASFSGTCYCCIALRRVQAEADAFAAHQPRLGAADESTFAEILDEDGGEYRARTGDLLVANQALSQLS